MYTIDTASQLKQVVQARHSRTREKICDFKSVCEEQWRSKIIIFEKIQKIIVKKIVEIFFKTPSLHIKDYVWNINN